MKPIIRNFLSVARRFKLAATLNVMGLSVAFTAFMIIMMQVDYDYSFDKCHKDYKKIFRVELTKNSATQTLFSRPLAELFIASSPQIVAGALTNYSEEETYFHIENEGERHYFKENSLIVTPEFFDVFTFDFVEGAKEHRLSPTEVFIPLSLSRKLFGKEPAVGKQLIHSNWGMQTVMGVYRDFPANSSVNNLMYFAMHPFENKQVWSSYNYKVFIRINKASNASVLFENFKRNFDPNVAPDRDFEWDEPEGNRLRLTALQDIHFVRDVKWDNTPKASEQTLMILLAIALLIIVIAAINFTNFSTALTPVRIKSINTRRVIGERRRSLRLSIVFEAIFISVLSFCVALCLIMLFKDTPLASLVDATLSITAHPLVVGGTALIAILTGLFAGSYPAHYMTSFSPALVLKGSFGLSPKGKKMRNTLIGIQFAASFALIICASFIYLQNVFVKNSPLGYDKEALITVNIEKIRDKRDVFVDKLKAYPGIKDVTFGRYIISSSDDPRQGFGFDFKGERVYMHAIAVHHTFLKVMGIEITEGRDFREEDTDLPNAVWIINETARKKYNVETGDIFQYEVIGIMPDLKYASFRVAVEPMAFHVRNGYPTDYAYIQVKAGADKRAALSHVRSTISELEPNYPFFEISFFDEVLQRLYEKENALFTLISLFSLIAIFISISGVFGLVVFDSECRRKEIGIRKVFGSSTSGIIIMFNKVYFRILMISFVFAVPFAWLIVNRWLQNFAYKTPMYWWVYLLAFTVVGLITFCTVTFQNWRVANDNPVNSIKAE